MEQGAGGGAWSMEHGARSGERGDGAEGCGNGWDGAELADPDAEADRFVDAAEGEGGGGCGRAKRGGDRGQ